MSEDKLNLEETLDELALYPYAMTHEEMTQAVLALARAVIRYRKELSFSIDYRTLEEIDADLAKALGVSP